MAPTERSALGGVKVLVVEDELMVAMLLEDMLLELGAEVVGPVGSGEKAVNLLDDERTIDVATLDINLKEGFVYEAAAQLRARGIPIVFVTGYDELPDCPPELKDTPRLSKPFRIAELGQTIAEAVASG